MPSRWPSGPGCPSWWRSGSSRRASGPCPDPVAGRPSERPAPMSPDRIAKTAAPAAEWAVQRRLDDLVGKLETKYGDLRGRVEVLPRPGVTFSMIGGAAEAKAAV